MLTERALESMPSPARRRVQDVFDAMKVATRVENKKVLVDLALGRKTENGAPGIVGARAVEVLDALYRSAASGRMETV